MLKLDDREWCEFFISGNNGIFEINATKSGIDKNKLIESDEHIVPYITRSDVSNGMNMFVSKTQNSKYKLDKGNCITIGLDTQTVFYQPTDFWTGQNIQVVNYEGINKYSALFICSMLKVQMEKFNWGGNGATLGRLSRTKVMLPVNKEGFPDYEFMENYVKEQEHQKIATYIEYCKKQLQKLGTPVKIEDIHEKNWKEFFITDLFDEILRGKRLKKEDHIEGNKPYVSSTAINNGVDSFIGNTYKVRTFSDCLSLANSGSVGACFYEPFEFIASDHVTHLKINNCSKYVYLFLSTMLSRLSEKYNFNREINDTRIKREKILLPVDQNEKPDFRYMEQYAKNMLIAKYQEYLNYQNS